MKLQNHVELISVGSQHALATNFLRELFYIFFLPFSFQRSNTLSLSTDDLSSAVLVKWEAIRKSLPHASTTKLSKSTPTCSAFSSVTTMDFLHAYTGPIPLLCIKFYPSPTQRLAPSVTLSHASYTMSFSLANKRDVLFPTQNRKSSFGSIPPFGLYPIFSCCHLE